MNWKIDYIEEYGIVKAKTSSQIGWNDKIKLSEEILAAGRLNNASAFLVGQKDTTSELSVLGVDHLPDTFRSIEFDDKDKMAILFNQDSPNSHLFTFLENVFSINSLRIKVFIDPIEVTT